MTQPSTLASTTILGSLAFLLAATQVYAADDINPNELVNLSLEQLSNIEVTSVSKKSEKASEAAAAIFVITQDDIRRSGMTTIPELLRMVPGLSVAQSGSHEWAITSRGFSGEFANKLLVLIDGRSVYTPEFSGVYWDVQDTLLQDIERIEVIRGPGATLWGANAVNGVINIITKSAKDTQGGLVSQSAGNVETSLTDVRYGAKIGDDAYMRAYAKYDDRKEFENTMGRTAHDQWNKAQSGFRTDGTDGGNVSYTFQGDIYRDGGGLGLSLPTLTGFNELDKREKASGANLLGRVNVKQSQTSDWSLQTYFDNTRRNNVITDTTNTFDTELQNTFTGLERNEIVSGIGYRLVKQDTEGTFYNFSIPAERSDNLFNGFVQDKIALVPKEFFLTLGSKFEHNDYTGFETQPSARLTWLIDDKQTLWSSVSHAVRTPNQFSENGSLVLSAVPGLFYVATVPNPSLASEELNAYETGYRIQALKNLSIDVSAFYNIYDKLVTNSVSATPMPLFVPGYGTIAALEVTPVNGNSGKTSGIEIVGKWEVTPWWQLSPSYSRLNFELKNPELTGFTTKGNSPKDQFNLRSVIKLPYNLEIDNAFYYVDKLPGQGIADYTRFDARIAWQAMDNLELSLVGQNLFKYDHLEYSPFLFQSAAEVPRSVYGNITWKF